MYVTQTNRSDKARTCYATRPALPNINSGMSLLLGQMCATGLREMNLDTLLDLKSILS